VKPLLEAEPDQSVIDAQAPRWHQLADILDAQLAKTKWLTGDDVSIADITVVAPMHLHAAQHLPLNQHPNLKRWLTKGIKNLPCWQKTQGAVNRALIPGAGATECTTMMKSMDALTEVCVTFNYTNGTTPTHSQLIRKASQFMSSRAHTTNERMMRLSERPSTSRLSSS